MNTRNKMVIVKGEVKTSEIISCKYNYEIKKWEVTFKNNNSNFALEKMPVHLENSIKTGNKIA